MTRDANPKPSIKEIFWTACEIESVSEREEYLRSAAGDDVDLRLRVQQMLASRQTERANHLDDAQTVLNVDSDQFTTPCTETVDELTQIGSYKLLDRLGEGGMGVVYLAEQRQPVERNVALKLIKRGMDSKDVIARFDAERQALALMNHPNIARVLEAGETSDGRPYFVMDLVRGIPITNYCAKHDLTLEQRLELFVLVCGAVQHAHHKGVIHRDLKPSNVLVELHDVRHVPKVIDFGLAKATNRRLTERTLFTQFSQMIGTPMYMSPEQAELSGLDVDTRSDVYSLGVLLYELTTGTTPFDRDLMRTVGFDEMRRIIREEEPPRPSHRNSTLRVSRSTTRTKDRQSFTPPIERKRQFELDWIVMKALEKDRTRRYESASALASDIKRYLNDEPVQACPPSKVYVIRKFARRNRGLVAATAAIAMLAIVAGGLLWNERARTRAALASETEQHDEAIRQRALAESERQRTRNLLYVSDMNLASGALREGDVPRAVNLLDRHLPVDNEPDLRDFAWHYLHKSVSVQRNWDKDFQAWIFGIEVSHDSRFLAASSQSGRIGIFRVSSGELVQTFSRDGEVNAIDWDPTGTRLASAWSDGSIHVWRVDLGSKESKPQSSVIDSNATDSAGDTESHPRLSIAGHQGQANSVCFTPDAKSIFSCGEDGLIIRWDAVTGQALDTLKGHQAEVEEIAISDSGTRLVSASRDDSIALWDLTRGKRVRTWRSPTDDTMLCVDLSPDGSLVAGGDNVGNLLVAHAETGHIASIRQLDRIHSVSFLAEELRVTTGDRAGAIQIRNVTVDKDGRPHLPSQPNSRWAAHRGRVQAIDTVSSTQAVISGGRDGHISSWTPHYNSTQWDCGMGSCMAIAHDDSLIVGCDQMLRFDLRARSLIGTLGPEPAEWEMMSAATDCLRSVTADDDGNIVVYDLERDVEIARWKSKHDPHRIAMSADGRQVAVSDWDMREHVEIFSVEDPSHPRIVAAPQCNCVAFGPRGQMLAVGSMDDLLLYDLAGTGTPIRLRGHGSGLTATCFSPDGKSLATVGDDRRLKLWDVATGKELFSTEAHRNDVECVAFSGDGRLIATGGQDRLVRLWSAQTLQPLLEMEAEDPIRQVAFASNDEFLVVRLHRGNILVFDGSPRNP